MKERISITDIARLAGVSSSTVSHVLNQTRYVSPEITERVMKIVADTGYHKNRLACSLRQKRTNTIGIILPSLNAGTYYGKSLEAIEKELSAHGYNLIMKASSNNPQAEKDAIEYLLSWKVDGIIIVLSDNGYDYSQVPCPVVLIDRAPEKQTVSGFYIDNYTITCQVMEQMLQKGYRKEAIINYIALLGWAPKDTNEEFFSMDDLIRIFDENGINKSPSIFDTNKLTWFNAEYIRRLTPEAYAEMAKPWLSQVLDPQKFDLDRLCQLLQARTEIFSQLPGMVDFLAEMPALDMALFTNKKSKSTPETSKAALEFIRPILSGMADWTEANLHDTVMAAIPESGMKNATVLWPLRIAITGRAATPGGAFEMAYLLGKDETMKRLDDAMAKL